MARRITVKKILSGIPNITKLTGFSDVNDSGLSETNGYLKYDSDNQEFRFASLSSVISGVSTVNSLNGDITIAGAGTVSVGTAGSTITITGSGGAGGGVDSAAVSSIITADVDKAFVDALNVDADTLDNQNGTYYLDYGNFTNTPTIPTVDSATIQPLARAAIVAGSNITYDSSTGVISSTGGGVGGGLDSAAVNSLIAAADTHDSAAVSGQITGTVTQSFINNLNVDAETLGGNDSTYYLNYSNFTNTPTIPTVDSATIRPLARAAIVAGSNITYDSATGVIASTASGGTDSATVVSIADSRIGVASIGDLSNVDLTGVSLNNVLKWDGSKFVAAVDATGSGGAGIALTDISANDAGGFGSFAYNNVSGVFTYTGADSADVKTVTNIPYSNLTGAPTIPTVDSATIRPLARAAIVAGTNITYDSATGVIASTASGGGGVDSAAVNTLIAAADTHDSALVQGQIDSNFTNDTTFVRVAGDEITGDINFGDNVKATFGNDSDFIIVHNGSHTVLKDQGTGSFYIEGSKIHLSSQNFGNPIFLTAGDNDGVKIFDSSGDLRLHSRDTGIYTYTGLFVDGNAVLTTASDTHDSSAVLGQINAKFANDATFSKDLTVDSNLTVGGYIGGPAVFTIDPAGIGDSTGKVIILGDLQVDGLTTTINSTTVSISDKNIVLADSATDSSQANGAGITVNGANATLQYASTGDKWVFNKAPFYNTDRLLTAADDTHDSAAVQGQIDSAVTFEFIDALSGVFDSGKIPDVVSPQVTTTYVEGLNISYTSLVDKPTIPALYTDFIDSAQAIIIADARIAAADTHDSNLVLAQITSTVDFDYITAAGRADSDYIKTVTGIDAGTLDNINSTEFLRSNVKDQKTAGSLVMNDAIALKFGTDSDHSISEAAGNLQINTAAGTFLKINTAGIRIHNAAGTENLLQATEDGAVTLYYDNAQKAITRSDGFEVTGHLISDSVQTTHIDIFGEVTHKPTPQNAGTGQTTVKSLPHNNVPCSITYNVHMKDINGTTTKGETSFTTVLCTLDSDLNTAYTEYGTLFTGDSEFGTFDVDADATNINLKFTRRSTRDGTIRVAAAKTVVL